MGKKKHRLTNTQVSGIIWITVVLITILAITFFSKSELSPTASDDSVFIKERANLKKIEDSAYHSRKSQYIPRPHYQNNPQKAFQSPQNDFYTQESPAPTRQPLTVDLNDADTTTLMLLHGIGPAFAKRIVKYRERLGGFSRKEQLLEVYGFTPQLLEHIAPHLRLDSSHLRKLDINSLGLKQLIRHPYMEYYFARDLVNLRSLGAIFSSSDDLRAIPSCTDTLLTKLLPYIDFGK